MNLKRLLRSRYFHRSENIRVGGYFTPNYESVRFDNTLGIVKKKKKKERE